MRQIKFRAWDKKRKRWLYFNLSSLIISNFEMVTSSKDEDVDLDTLTQFTGLKDKNGKEIYEGDIFDSPSGNKFNVVWFKDGFFYQNVFDKTPSGHLIRVTKDWEVVGNIYENPKLLK